jgi:hypothetical protein
MKTRRLLRCGAASLEGRPASQSGVDASLVVVDGEAIQLAMEVEAIPEVGLIQIFAPKGSDQPLDERQHFGV